MIVEDLFFSMLWKNSALNMAPSNFNVHNHTQTYPHTSGAMTATADMQPPIQAITDAMRKAQSPQSSSTKEKRSGV